MKQLLASASRWSQRLDVAGVQLNRAQVHLTILRGVPNSPVTCDRCGRLRAARKDRLCHGCRIKGRPNSRQRFFWTPVLDDRLRRAYAGAHSRAELSQNLSDFQRISGFTRVVIVTRARILGLTARRARPWGRFEATLICDKLGSMSTHQIAKTLGRTYYSVKAKARELHVRTRVTEGYTISDLQSLLGVGKLRVQGWITRGWVKLKNDRVTETSVRRFLSEHPHEYHLSRVDESWTKPRFSRRVSGSELQGMSVPRRLVIQARSSRVILSDQWQLARTLPQSSGSSTRTLRQRQSQARASTSRAIAKHRS